MCNFAIAWMQTVAEHNTECPLPLFLFHLRTPDGLEEDDLGIELPDVEHAYLEAYRAIPETVVDLMRQGVEARDHVFVIADAEGAVLMEVPLSEPLHPQQKGRPLEPFDRARRLSGEIAAEIARARETAQQSREILARARETMRQSHEILARPHPKLP